MRTLEIFALLVGALSQTHAGRDLGWESDLDLTNFVTRPDLKAPLFNVTVYEQDLVTPGYWFVGPYTDIKQKPHQPKYYRPCQTGPHIYDSDGELVYSGACEFGNQNACDFRALEINGSYFLSTILVRNYVDPVGRGIIMDDSYQIVAEILPQKWEEGINMHELNIVDGGKSALIINQRSEYVEISEVEGIQSRKGYILNVGFREVDIQSGETLFQWWAYPEVSLSESTEGFRKGINGPFPEGWNWFHGNSVVKNSKGDYLISSRYTDAIYKISGATGKLQWRLGGLKSDFELIAFNFSRQHDAQWIEEECSAEQEVITFLDNGGDGVRQSASTTSALKVVLNLQSMTAVVAERWLRPDRGVSYLRGNFQRLQSSGNLFISWSENSYFSEHTQDGRVIMEAKFTSNRMVTYRAYKMNFTGNPLEPPVVKAYSFGVDVESSTTVSYVSWNGATEVHEWRFYNSNGTPIGCTERRGFETRIFSKGTETSIYAEAVNKAGVVLGRSETREVVRPPEWAPTSLPVAESQKSDIRAVKMSSDSGSKAEL